MNKKENDMEARIEALREQFHTLFGEKEARVWSAPGRTEIGGNHTDHNHGRVLAAGVKKRHECRKRQVRGI